MTHINDISVDDSPNVMFVGEKGSGIGRFNGDWIIAKLTTDHLITVQHEPRQYPFRIANGICKRAHMRLSQDGTSRVRVHNSVAR